MKEQKIRIVALRVGQAPKVEYLDNTLKAMQAFVGGLIDIVPADYKIENGIDLYLNDEGKVLCMRDNRVIWDGEDVLNGDGFLAGCDEETGETISLTDEQIGWAKKKFSRFFIYDDVKEV